MYILIMELYTLLLTALRTPSSDIPLSHLEVFHFHTGSSKTMIVLATNLFRRCSVNNGDITVHSLLQRGCPTMELATAILQECYACSKTNTRVPSTCYSLNDDTHNEPLLTHSPSLSYSPRNVQDNIVNIRISYNTWLKRLSHIPKKTLYHVFYTVSKDVYHDLSDDSYIFMHDANTLSGLAMLPPLSNRHVDSEDSVDSEIQPNVNISNNASNDWIDCWKYLRCCCTETSFKQSKMK